MRKRTAGQVRSTPTGTYMQCPVQIKTRNQRPTPSRFIERANNRPLMQDSVKKKYSELMHAICTQHGNCTPHQRSCPAGSCPCLFTSQHHPLTQPPPSPDLTQTPPSPGYPPPCSLLMSDTGVLSHTSASACSCSWAMSRPLISGSDRDRSEPAGHARLKISSSP